MAEDWKLEVGESYVGVYIRNKAAQALVEVQIMMVRFDSGQ